MKVLMTTTSYQSVSINETKIGQTEKLTHQRQRQRPALTPLPASPNMYEGEDLCESSPSYMLGEGD